MNTEHTADWHAGPICIDELVTVMGQYDRNIRWNGWLCPRIDAFAVEQVMEAIASESADNTPTHQWNGDVLWLIEHDGDKEYVEEMPPDEDGLYPLGAWSWVWAEDHAHPDYVDPDAPYRVRPMPEIETIGDLLLIEDDGHSLDGSDPRADNLRRASFAARAVLAFAEATGSDLDTVIPDLLGDLQHLIDLLRDEDGHPFPPADASLDQGTTYYEAEIKGEL